MDHVFSMLKMMVVVGHHGDLLVNRHDHDDNGDDIPNFSNWMNVMNVKKRIVN